jgi:hypothetical protein
MFRLHEHTLISELALIVGRQNTAWKTFGYIPTDWVDPSGSTGLPTREASRALEVSAFISSLVSAF